MTSFTKIEGKVQNYGWGGHHFIAELTGTSNPGKAPVAEYWLGAHPSSPSMVLRDGRPVYNLPEFLQAQAAGEMNFLFKILDVREMLSIQVHPSKIQARHGFERENAAGIPLDAKHRNYKDRSDKPEMMVALSPFWLLHGLKSQEEIQRSLGGKPYLEPLLTCLTRFGVVAAFQMALNHFNPSVQAMHKALVTDFQKPHPNLEKLQIEFWIHRWISGNPGTVNGILTLFFMNLLKLEPGQAIYQPPGLLHAYLEGQNVELMANSDNVLRAGLTTKHIDVPELLAISNLEPTDPRKYLLKSETDRQFIKTFRAPIREFELSELGAEQHQRYEWQTHSVEVLFCVRGGAEISSRSGQRDLIIKGQAVLILPGESIVLKCDSDAHFFRAINRP